MSMSLTRNGTNASAHTDGGTFGPPGVVFGAVALTMAVMSFWCSTFSMWRLIRVRLHGRVRPPSSETTESTLLLCICTDDALGALSVVVTLILNLSLTEPVQPQSALCTSSAFLHTFSGLTGSLHCAGLASVQGKRSVYPRAGAISAAVVVVTLCLFSALGVWGDVVRRSWGGCFVDATGTHGLLVFVVYAVALCRLTQVALPTIPRLFCALPSRTSLLGERSSTMPLKPEITYLTVERSGVYLSPATDSRSLVPITPSQLSCVNHAADVSGGSGRGFEVNNESSDGTFVKKRCVVFIAFLRVLLWLPLMVGAGIGTFLMVSALAHRLFMKDTIGSLTATDVFFFCMRHMAAILPLGYVGNNQPKVGVTVKEAGAFFLSVLAMGSSPLLLCARHWLGAPCGCTFNWSRLSHHLTDRDHRGARSAFGFNLSFHKGYSVYGAASSSTPHYNFTSDRVRVVMHTEGTHDRDAADKITMPPTLTASPPTIEASQHVPSATSALMTPAAEGADGREGRSGAGGSRSRRGSHLVSAQVLPCDFRDEVSAMFAGHARRPASMQCSERRRSERRPTISNGHNGIGGTNGSSNRAEGSQSREAGLHAESPDWEWVRSMSDRAPRQRAGSGLATQLCAIQGMVSLRSPTGKTLSLSTYEVSGTGSHALPVPQKVEVYRSKSVGHQPEAGSSGGMAGCGGGGITDTNVKIHLEVLEICNNGDADAVSIVSNISQASTRARSPSLRYSRKENRFVSVELDESASYSLHIPASNPDNDSINISIPDTVEAHRRNSRKDSSALGMGSEGISVGESPDIGNVSCGYQEDIQFLNKAYREREAQTEDVASGALRGTLSEKSDAKSERS